MSTLIRNWRDMPAGREKYQTYLASREWAILKQGVHKRSGGKCERCRHADGEQVHHQTYERIYRETPEDLLHVCRPCHEFVSGKRARDPILDAPVRLFGRIIENVYLAGKITGTAWRDEIARGWSYANHSEMDHSDCLQRDWAIVENCLPIPDGRSLSLAGPFWRDLWGGHGSVFYNSGPHAFGWSQDEEEEEDTDIGRKQAEIDENRRSVFANLFYAIRDSHLVFAWIDSLDCYGTLFELGYATGHDLFRVVACPPDFDHTELWLAFMTNFVIRADSPGEAWKAFWTDPASVLRDRCG